MIKSIKAKKILNSRKEPTIQVKLMTNKGIVKASVPSGASTGSHEAKTVDIKQAIYNVNKVIAFKLKGMDETKQEQIDRLMIKLDGTKNKSKLGANAILAVSIAVCRAGALAKDIPLYEYLGIGKSFPKPCFNIINGGVHAKNKLDIQEFMIIPQERTFKENFRIGKLVFKRLKKDLKKEYGKLPMGDEGGFSPPFSKETKALDFIVKSIGDYNVKIGLDCAASSFYSKGKYKIDGKKLNKKQLLDFYVDIVDKYPIISIEDPFQEKDAKGFAEITKKLNKVTIIGDDFLTTNIGRIKKYKDNCNGVIIKPNQIGTITETLEAIKLAKSYKWKIMVSHRSGETMDDFIADLSLGCDYIKSGAPSKKERLVKYIRLLKLEKLYG
jgi:enolase